VRKVQAALETEPRIKLHQFPIRVALVGGALRLEGEVENVAARRLALRRASEAAGTGEVVDHQRIVPSDPRGDGEILDALEQSLLRECDLKNCTLRRGDKGKVEILHEAVSDDSSGNILFAVADGIITLEGHVISLSHRRVIEALAWWVPGCRRVDNRLAVVPAEDDHDHELNDAVRLVLELDPHIHADQIGVATNLGIVTLQGCVPRREERERAEHDAWCVSGVNEVFNHLEVGP
jgi:osmotically-inducible protein OsmY